MFEHLAIKTYFDKILQNFVRFDYICCTALLVKFVYQGIFGAIVQLNWLDKLYHASLIYETVHGCVFHDSAKHLKLHVTVKNLFTQSIAGAYNRR